MPEEISRTIDEAKPIFFQKWVFEARKIQLNHSQQERYNNLWLTLFHSLCTNKPDSFLKQLDADARFQARDAAHLEVLLARQSTVFNLVWESISSTTVIESRPSLLYKLTGRLNNLRSLAESSLLNGFLDETQTIQREQAAANDRKLRQKLENMSVQDLIKNIPSFRTFQCKQGHMVVQPGDNVTGLYLILSGSVRIYEILPDGRSISLSLLSKGDVFAHTRTHQQGYFRDVYIEAMQDSHISFIQEKALENLMINSPLLSSCIISSFSNQLSQSQKLIEGILGRSVALRLGRLLLKLADEYGVCCQNDNSIIINLNLTHQELADMLGSNRVTVTRKLLEFQRQNLISIDNRTISIINKQALEQIAA
jgi:CRP/FNR family transcriptional regulator